MHTSILAASTLFALALAVPDHLKPIEDLAPCSSFGSDCATQNKHFCDDATGNMSVCHHFREQCWIEHTGTPCSSGELKREPAGFPEAGKGEGRKKRAGFPEDGKEGFEKRAGFPEKGKGED